MLAILARDNPPSAALAHNDPMALGALTALQSHGLRIPDNLPPAGSNDLPLVGRLSPPLTTVRYPSLEAGRAAGELTLELLGGAEAGSHSLDPELVQRLSTRPIGT